MRILDRSVYVGPPLYAHFPVIRLELDLGELEAWPTVRLGGGFIDALATALPGLAAHMEPETPGMHTTATVDYEFVVSGRVVLELDDGATRELHAGDTVIQNGTRHAWRNPFDETALMVVVLIGADHRDLG